MVEKRLLICGGALAPNAQQAGIDQGFTLASTKPYPAPAELIAAANEMRATAIIVRMGRITRDVIEGIPTLRIIAKHGVGVDTIDLAAAAGRGIPVIVAGGANTQSVAEQALALLLSVARSTAFLDRRLRQGAWDKSTYAGSEIMGRSVGLIGLGAIGRAFLNLLTPFQMTVRIFDPFLPDDLLPAGAQRCAAVEDLLRASDIVSLHCPLTDSNRGLIDATAISWMKPDAILINTARGELVDEPALVDALRTNRLAGAGLDTFAQEPPGADSPLWSLDNLVASPHVGANTRESRDRMGLSVLEQIADYLATGAIVGRNHANPQMAAAA